MVWGWLVSWGSLVGWLVFWVVWFTGVGDSLDTAIGKVDGVGSRQGLSIGGFSSVEFG